MSKRKEAVAEPVAQDPLADPAIAQLEPQPEAAEPTIDMGGFTAEELGIPAVGTVDREGNPITAEDQARAHDDPGIWPHARGMADKAHIDATVLHELARQYRAVYPLAWRSMLVTELQKRIEDPTRYSPVEMMSRGIRNVSREVAVLRERFNALLDTCGSPENQVVALQAACAAVKAAAKGKSEEQRRLLQATVRSARDAGVAAEAAKGE